MVSAVEDLDESQDTVFEPDDFLDIEDDVELEELDPAGCYSLEYDP